GEMVLIRGGSGTMGSMDGAEDEQPMHDVKITEFWMDSREVTNAEFARFVSATGYVTTAEKPRNAGVYEGEVLEAGVKGSLCFQKDFSDNADADRNPLRFVEGANWRHPQGTGSDLKGKENFPVVHVSWEDA